MARFLVGLGKMLRTIQRKGKKGAGGAGSSSLVFLIAQMSLRPPWRDGGQGRGNIPVSV
jgi:hypothetical protein